MLEEKEKLLEGRSLLQWQEEYNGIQKKILLLQAIEKALNDVFLYHTEVRRWRQKLQQWQEQHQQSKALLEQQQALRDALEISLASLERERMLALRIASLEQHRASLEEGHACPLCGSLEHPYLLQGLPASDNWQQVEDVRRRFTVTDQQCAALRERLTGLEQSLLVGMEDARSLQDKLQEAQNYLAQLAEKAGLPSLLRESPENAVTFVREQQGRMDEFLRELYQRISTADKLEKACQMLESNLPRLQEQKAMLDQTVERLEHELDMITAEQQRVRQEAGQLQQEEEQGKQTLDTMLAAYGLGTTDTELLSILSALKARRAEWECRTAEMTRLTASRQELELSAGQHDQEVKSQQAHLESQQREAREREGQWKKLHEQRLALFAEKDVQEVEADLAQAVSRDEQRLADQTAAVSRMSDVVTMTESAIREKDALLASIAEQSVHAGQAFAQGLEQEAFADERSFLQACLPAEERESLERLSQELHAARMELAGRGRAAREHLATETAKALTTKNREELGQELAVLEQHQAALQQEQGSCLQRLADNERLRQEQRVLVERIEQQERVFEQWSALQELIGSADGKKFRNIVQQMNLVDFYGGGYTYFRRWHRFSKNSGGLTVEKGCHCIDMLNMFAQARPVRVAAFGGLNRFVPNDNKAVYCSECTDKKSCDYYMNIEKEATGVLKNTGVDEQIVNGGQKIDLCVFNSEKDTFDNSVMIIEYANGCRATLGECFTSSVPEKYDRTMVLNCWNGQLWADMQKETLEFFANRPGQSAQNGAGENIPLSHIPGLHGGADTRMLEYMVHTLENGLPNLEMNSLDGYYAVAVGEAAEVAIKNHQVVEIENID